MPSSKFSSFHEANVISVRCLVPGILTSDLLSGWSLLRLPCGAANTICILGAVNGKSPRSRDSAQSAGAKEASGGRGTYFALELPSKVYSGLKFWLCRPGQWKTGQEHIFEVCLHSKVCTVDGPWTGQLGRATAPPPPALLGLIYWGEHGGHRTEHAWLGDGVTMGFIALDLNMSGAPLLLLSLWARPFLRMSPGVFGNLQLSPSQRYSPPGSGWALWGPPGLVKSASTAQE